MKNLLLFLPLLTLIACQADKDSPKVPSSPLERARAQLKSYDSLAQTQVLVLGTLHFGEEVLEAENQESIAQLIEQLKAYQPTKVVIEWEPERFERTNEAYRQFLRDSFDISDRYNEVFQLGFRLAREMTHDSIYLFDDQTEFIGSLAEFATEDDPFSFELFTQYAQREDDGFYNLHEETLIATFGYNQSLLDSLSLRDRIALLNSPEHQRINGQRMHMYETRVGIGKTYVGPDWLGRWYRRNVRMMSNVLQFSEAGDRILIIVGDNHKWTLDMLFEHTPDFEVVSSWDYLREG